MTHLTLFMYIINLLLPSSIKHSDDIHRSVEKKRLVALITRVKIMRWIRFCLMRHMVKRK